MRTKKQTLIFYAIGGFLILLLVALAVPNFLPARFVGHELLTIQIHVTDQKTGQPVAHVQVRLLGRHEDVANPWRAAEAVTDAHGNCEFKKGFEATGVIGRSGQFHMSDQILLVVRADGFKIWESPLATVFGPSRDYYKGSKVLAHIVSLEAQPEQRRN